MWNIMPSSRTFSDTCELWKLNEHRVYCIHCRLIFHCRLLKLQPNNRNGGNLFLSSCIIIIIIYLNNLWINFRDWFVDRFSWFIAITAPIISNKLINWFKSQFEVHLDFLHIPQNIYVLYVCMYVCKYVCKQINYLARHSAWDWKR